VVRQVRWRHPVVPHTLVLRAGAEREAALTAAASSRSAAVPPLRDSHIKLLTRQGGRV
jgi:hypothetical protein